MEGEEVVHVSRTYKDQFMLLLFRLVLLSLDDKSVERCGFVTVYELVLFLNWGTPLLNVFINEVDVFQ